ncbi:LLM class flavin-dependent oxidoreductase [Rhodovarius crocodyli]|uniref:LLM class flavin-dependent oxidoreductase n=1 Tax=Rhodovarius crocodyli TaxID=1979269 RepID=A0A437ME01_9PROT|nr:LLM class flavin-dependent oxidoreductase [Rhodovarius crocodyli]RVT95890.1 LLM class flavin-dependent oxidoreductase [Rhodovarius crocodyli]
MPIESPRRISLGVSMAGLGYHPAAWRHPETPAGGNMSLDHYIHMARTAERGLFDMLFLADGVGIRNYDEPKGAQQRSAGNVHFEPLTLLSALAMVTRHVGLVATASTTWNEPYHVARKFASLDHISGGRAGWNVVTSHTDMEAQNFGAATLPPKDRRYSRAEEFVEVVRGLWDSWDDDAFLRDQASGQNYFPERRHVLDHEGEHFRVRGPLNVARPPQGHPVIVQAGASDRGRDLAAATADVIYVAAPTLPEAQEFYADVKGRMAAHGRAPEALRIMPGLLAIVGETEAEARAKYERLQSLVDPVVGLAQLAFSMGDLSAYDVDGPVPLLPEWRQSRGQLMYEMAQREGLTIRGLFLAIAAGNGHAQAIGTPAQIADQMQEWFEAGGADGFNLLPAHSPGGLEDFVNLVVPELQRRGLYRTEYEGETLRDRLGLPRPASRY